MKTCSDCQWHYQQTNSHLTCRKDRKIMPVGTHACPDLVPMDAPHLCDVVMAAREELAVQAQPEKHGKDGAA